MSVLSTVCALIPRQLQSEYCYPCPPARVRKSEAQWGDFFPTATHPEPEEVKCLMALFPSDWHCSPAGWLSGLEGPLPQEVAGLIPGGGRMQEATDCSHVMFLLPSLFKVQ